MQQTSYEDLVTSRTKLKTALSCFNLAIPKGSWLERAYDLVERLNEIYKDSNHRAKFFKKENHQRDVFFALLDVLSLKDILSYFSGIEKRTLKGKLKRILKMSAPHNETIENNEARNTLWELELFSFLKRANIQVELKDPNPDILVSFNKRKYYIQCKRLFASNENALKRNIHRALIQLQKDLDGKNNNHLGIMALSLERPFVQIVPKLVVPTEQLGKEILVNKLKAFISQYGYLWQTSERVKDPRIIGAMLFITTLSEIQRDQTLARASYMLINNTWANGSGFQQINEDFGPLKQSIEV